MYCQFGPILKKRHWTLGLKVEEQWFRTFLSLGASWKYLSSELSLVSLFQGGSILEGSG